MAYYRQRGSVPPKRHTQHRAPDGGLYYEELMGEEGFSADSSLLYHRELPSAIVDARVWRLPDLSTVPNAPLLPRHLRLHELFKDADVESTDTVTGRRLVLANADVRISYVVAQRPSPLYRNAIGDECVYIESGSSRVETVFGALDARQGDYILLPRATTHRWLPAPDGWWRSTSHRSNGWSTSTSCATRTAPRRSCAIRTIRAAFRPRSVPIQCWSFPGTRHRDGSPCPSRPAAQRR